MENYVANVIPHLQAWWPVFFLLAYLLAIICAFVSCLQAISPKNRFNRGPAVYSFWAAVLLSNLPAFMDSLSMSIFNKSSEQALSYSPPASPGSVYIQFAVYAIMSVGIIGVIRGICLFWGAAARPENFSRAVVHMIGGAIAVNIVDFLRGIGASVKGDVQTYIATIIG
jgi:ABC-type Mn2+/Zn2+ transport system permease subunit